MGQNRLWVRLRRVWVMLGIAATIIFVGWSLIAYRASAEARAAARSDAAVGITREDGIWHFNPANHHSGASTGLLFFPGALVDPTAYAPLARAVASAGHHVIIVELPRRGAFGGAKDPDLLVRATRQMREGRQPQPLGDRRSLPRCGSGNRASGNAARRNRRTGPRRHDTSAGR